MVLLNVAIYSWGCLYKIKVYIFRYVLPCLLKPLHPGIIQQSSLRFFAQHTGKTSSTLTLGLCTIVPALIWQHAEAKVKKNVNVSDWLGLVITDTFQPVINMEYEATIDGFKCLQWLPKHEIAHHTYNGALLDIVELLGCICFYFFSRLHGND